MKLLLTGYVKRLDDATLRSMLDLVSPTAYFYIDEVLGVGADFCLGVCETVPPWADRSDDFGL